MHFDAFDRYHEKESLIHRLDPRVKAAVSIVYILSNSFLPDGAWLAFLMAWIFLLTLNALSQLGIGYTLKRSFIALPFALIAITVLFTVPGKPILTLGYFSSPLIVTDGGLIRFSSILIRSWLSVQFAILLVASTRFPDLIHALEHLRVPSILTAIISFLYRYLFVLTDEVYRMLKGRESRSAAIHGHRPGGSVMWRAKIAGNMAGQLFLRSYERSDRIYNAMLSRGYTGRLYTLHPHEMKRGDYFATAIAVAAVFILQVTGRMH